MKFAVIAGAIVVMGTTGKHLEMVSTLAARLAGSFFNPAGVEE